ncbi:glycosyltransferase [Vibrio parahaemolyticus]|nr:glycosyltransferase family 4 protein [Vibrio parahaemolyticus]MDF4334966.1 glycosyltransferase [Vibrio parahaemolyticus]
MKIGLYCNWSVFLENDGFYISPIHGRYIKHLINKGNEVVLMSNITSDRSKINNWDYFPFNDVCLLSLPEFSSYISSVRYFKDIFFSARRLNLSSDFIYVRTFEPFAWLFGILDKKSNLAYHIISNPISSIMTKKGELLLKKILKCVIFFPEYLLTLIVASRNSFSCNGYETRNKLPVIFRNKVKPVIESSLIPEDFFLREYYKKKKVKYITVCDLRPAKGVDLLIEAFSLLVQSGKVDAELTVVGDGEYRETLEILVKECGLTEHVTFTGFVPAGEELNAFYRGSDIFVMPSLSETGPRVLLEAMANSLYCISTDVGYSKFLLDQCEGTVVPVNDIDALFTAMVETSEYSKEVYNKAVAAYHTSSKYTLQTFWSFILNS